MTKYLGKLNILEYVLVDGEERVLVKFPDGRIKGSVLTIFLTTMDGGKGVNEKGTHTEGKGKV